MAVIGLATIAAADDARPVDRPPLFLMGELTAPSVSAMDYQIVDAPGRAGVSPTMADQRETGRFIAAKSETDTWSVNERVAHLDVGAPLAIPQTATRVPQELWALEGGIAYNHDFTPRRALGLAFNVGSDSNKPFYSIHETVFRATASYRLPSKERNAWLFFLNYSNNRHFLNNIPLPGVGYFFVTDNNKLEGLVGFPFVALRYTPVPKWSGQVSIFGPRNVNAEINRQIVGAVHLYTAFQWNAEEWFLADRVNTSDRLFFDKKRAALGVRVPLSRGLLVDLSGGRQFDQRFFVHDSSSYRDVPTAGLRPTWFMQAKLTHRF